MGSPPEDDAGAGEGAPEAAVDRPAPPVNSDRQNALAARMDAFLAAHSGDDDEEKKPTRPPTSSESESIDIDDIEEVEAEKEASAPVVMPPMKPPVIPPPRPTVAIPPPRPAIPAPPRGAPSMKPPAIPPPRASQPIPPVIASIPPRPPPPAPERTRPPSDPPPVPMQTRTKTGDLPPRPPTGEHARIPTAAHARVPTGEHARIADGRVPTGEHARIPTGEHAPVRTKNPSVPPPPPGAPERIATGQHPPVTTDDVLGQGSDVLHVEGGVEVSTATPNIVVDQPLEAHLETPTVVDKAVEAMGEAGAEQRAEMMSKELEAKVLSDPSAAAYIAYELGELYERRLADEARSVKAFGRALDLDPSLRPNLWAIRRVFYKRGLWPNIAKLVDAEVQYARDDAERADLLLEKARVCGHRLDEPGEARNALDEAVAIAPQHQGVLLELERFAAKQGDMGALLDVWERLAEAVEQPARKIAYWVEVGRAAGAAGEAARANEAFEKAAQLAGTGPSAERVARERLRAIEDRGTTDEITAAIDALATVLLAAFGPAGPSAEASTEKATAIRHELVALRRRQAQLVRTEQPEKAWELLQQASAIVPGEPIVLADMTELAEELGRYQDLAELVSSWQSAESDPARAMSLSIRRADALLRGGQLDQARALLASLEAAAPGFVVLTSAAERDALARKDPAALARTLLSAAHAALLGTWLGPGQESEPDPQAAAALYVQAAELLAYEAAAPDAPEAPELYTEARAALGKALEAVADYPAAVEALVELDDATGQIAEALARLRGAAERAAAPDKRPLIERAIRLARSHGDLEAVLALELELVALAPEDLAARWRLESTYAQLGKEDERAELLAKLAADETDATRRGTALHAAARLRERAGAVEIATDLYRQVLAVWPEDTFARESLVDLLRAQEKWSELVTERRAEARALPDGPTARRALREAAWVLEVRLGDAAQAAQVYEDWAHRFADDRAALEGVARCKVAAGDTAGEVRARATLAEADGSAEARWLYARALERAGQQDEAAEQYRAMLATEEPEPTLAAIGATLALSDLAAARGDTVMRVEATASLAGRTSDPVLGGALAEDSGWMYALVLEDFDRAAASFEAAVALDPTRRGALLGAALVAARRGDHPALAAAYEGLGAAVQGQMPEASAALLLRGAAMAAAAGDLDLANQRVNAARIAAPDDTSALLVAAETGANPQVDASDAFAAVDPLLARAEVLEMRGALADDPAAAASWELDRAEALELAGRLREAGAVVAAVIKTRPDDLRAISALRRMAKRTGDKSTAASAAYALARVIGDRTAKLDLLREAVAIFDGSDLSKNMDYAIATFRRIVALEPGAIELERLLELLRERADTRGLVNAISDRLSWLEAEGGAVQTMVPLLLERATVLHGLGETEAAMGDLDVLLDREPRNVEALRFRADLAFNAGDVDVAVSLWRRYLAAETRAPRRAEIELQLSQVLAENTGDIAGAIEQLERVVESQPDDVQLRERLLGLCMRANDFDRAAKELKALARMRATPPERAREELRLGLMMRDKLDDRIGARMALDRARTLDPLNLDVVRELADLLEPSARGDMLSMTASNMRDAIVNNPRGVQLYERLAQINAWQADVDARWVALAAVEALSPTAATDQKQVLAQGRQQLKAPSKIKLDDAARKVLRGDLTGPLVELWRAIAPGVQVATGVDAGKLGFGRGDRIAVKKLGDKYEPLATALACFGVDEADIYISASRGGVARALAGETPVLCLGADVAAASTGHQRFLLGRAVATLAEGLATLADLREAELPWTFAAALRACEVPVPAHLAELVAGEDASIAERAKVLKKELSRKAKAAVAQAVGRGNALGNIDEFRTTALAVGQRAGLLWSGDLAVALGVLDVGKGGRQLTDSVPALALVAWSVGKDHLDLRAKLGVALKGAAR